MIANALLIALAVLLACLFGLMGELKFLVPYKRVIFAQYGTVLLAWFGILFGNLEAKETIDHSGNYDRVCQGQESKIPDAHDPRGLRRLPHR